MKRILHVALLVLAILGLALGPALAHAGADDFVFSQRNSTDTGANSRVPPHPTTGPGLFHFDSVALTGSWVTLSSHLQVTSGTLGVSVLGVAATPQAYVHLTAVAP